ncbi:hypothetical protein EJ02DRAFT_180875 [Clathrospora elynae]|uniref:Uncharacterized protein n=1 Tax=Clathrospora elynae TaxID=706981 RepID=A0A6A5SRG6_9PLEO|nr:hypothetical protein EJ02DRAFT_180875 [Clathrospora elynae]
MGVPSQSSTTASHKRVTYSRRPGAASNARNGSAASNAIEVEGEHAYDKIRWFARSSNQNRGGSAMGAHIGAQSKSLAGASSSNQKPCLKFADTVQKTEAVRHEGTRSTKIEEKDDIAVAIARSLADSASSPSVSSPIAPKTQGKYAADVAKAKLMSLSNDKVSAPSIRPSYAKPGKAGAPHAALPGLLEDMHITVKALENKARESLMVDPEDVAVFVRGWEGKMFGVNLALEAVEQRRIKDIQMHLDFDSGLVAKHKEKLKQANLMWEVKMRAREKQWEKKMEEQKQTNEVHITEQKQVYEARLVKQNVAKPSPPPQESQNREQTPKKEHTQLRTTRSLLALTHEHVAKPSTRTQQQPPVEEHMQPRTVRSPSSYIPEGIADYLEKVDRLCVENVALRETLKAKDDDSAHKEELEKLKQMHEAQLGLLRQKVERLADTNAELRRRKENDGQATLTVSNSPNKRKLGSAASSRAEITGSSPKKARN